MLRIEPIPPRLPGAPAASGPAPATPPVGSVLSVEAVRDTASGQLLLMLAGRKFVLKPGGAAMEVQAGDKLTVRVTRNEPEIELALVSRTDDVAAALRRELPQQASPLRLLANLLLLARPASANAPAATVGATSEAPLASLPSPVAAAVEALLKNVPEAKALATPEGLMRAVASSGAQLEHLLAAAPKDLETALGSDWKASLLRLKDALVKAGATRVAAVPERSDAPLPTRHGVMNAVPPETASLTLASGPDATLGQLVQQAQESIARVTCNQLASLDSRQQAALPMVLEIPYRHADEAGLLRVRVDRETRPQATGPVWSVEFALDLGAYGPLRGRVTLAEGHVSVTLQAEQAALAQAIDARFEELRGSLSDAGLPIGKLSCARSDPVNAAPTGTWLVNLRA